MTIAVTTPTLADQQPHCSEGPWGALDAFIMFYILTKVCLETNGSLESSTIHAPFRSKDTASTLST